MTTLLDLAGTPWTGRSELWLDPLGDAALISDCAITVLEGSIEYTWSHEGAAQRGTIALTPRGARFTDTFHAAVPMDCAARPDAWGLVDVFGTYGAGDGPPWGWRIQVSLRPSDELVVQMTNVTPWGEEGRAVRMVGARG
jgi:hypothetical protein